MATASEVQSLLLRIGVALTMSGDAVSLIEERLHAIAVAYGYPRARISVLPTLLIVDCGEGAGMRTIDSARELRLDQTADVIGLASRAERKELTPAEVASALTVVMASRSRFGTAAYIGAHALLTLGIGLVIHPTAVDLWVYVALGLLVGAMKAWGERYPSPGYFLAFAAAAIVSAVAFLAHGGDDAASLRLTIPPLVTFLPGALLTMGTVDLAMGETVTGASRFVAGLLALAVLAIGIVVGAELIGDPSSGPVAGSPADTLGSWAPWLGVLLFGVGIYVHNSAPERSLPWLLLVLFTAFAGQLAGKEILDATLSGFVGAAIMVPVAHLVARAPSAPPAHVTILPAFWLLVPGAIGLIGITEIVGEGADTGSEHFLGALVSIPSVALGVLVGTMFVRALSSMLARSVRRARPASTGG